MSEPLTERERLLFHDMAEQRKCHHENYQMLAKITWRFEREAHQARREADLLRLELESQPPWLRWLAQWL